MELELPSGANRKRIGTAKTGNRDERHPLPVIGLELAVSGSDPAVPLSQDPAKARRFLGCSLVAAAKSLQPQTTWRWGESNANPSLGAESLLSRENTGNSVDSGPIENASWTGGRPVSGHLRRDFPGGDRVRFVYFG
jgi:hypothetical protein